MLVVETGLYGSFFIWLGTYLNLTHSTLFKCEFLLLSVEQRMETSFGIAVCF